MPPSPARCASIIANLTPALGRQDHATSPCAPRHTSCNTTRPSLPGPTFRDVRDTPLLRARDAHIEPVIWRKKQRKQVRHFNTTGKSAECLSSSFLANASSLFARALACTYEETIRYDHSDRFRGRALPYFMIFKNEVHSNRNGVRHGSIFRFL